MSNGAFAQKIAHFGHHVMRSPSGWLVNYDHTVKRHASGIVYVAALIGQIDARTTILKGNSLPC